jgi:hypothetical protein
MRMEKLPEGLKLGLAVIFAFAVLGVGLTQETSTKMTQRSSK